MNRELTPIDISNLPDLIQIAEEVRISGRPRLLRRNREDIAMLVPVAPTIRRRPRGRKPEADHQAFLSSAGSWKGNVDTDKLIADIYESRRLSSRPPVEM